MKKDLMNKGVENIIIKNWKINFELMNYEFEIKIIVKKSA